jgi:DNA-binding HxlR family transcriptional regulator
MVATMAAKRAQSGGRSSCPIANTLDLVGDRWTLVVIRDLMFSSRRRFGELLESAERIPTNILADRLKRLQKSGIVEKRAYQERPTRYEYVLTDKGLELFEVLRALVVWGAKHAEGSAQLTPEQIDALAPVER